MRDVFITGVGEYLPGPPVPNADIEDYIGRVSGRSSTFGVRALRWNGVRTRHYAFDRNGSSRHSNASMCAKAVQVAASDAGLELNNLTFLAAATTQGDLLVPGHAAQVQAELQRGPMEIASFQSVCGASLMAAKAAWLNVRAGEHAVAAACAGEFSSRWFRPSFYEGTALVDAKGRLSPEADFLRFTLSDGAGAVVMEAQPPAGRLGLRVRSIEIVSMADQFAPCMMAGAPLGQHEKAWGLDGPSTAHAAGGIALAQDFQSLKRIIRAWIGVYLQRVEDGRIDPATIDHLLFHYSAHSIREDIITLLRDTNGMINEARWFSVLADVGNVGSASIWVMLARFMKSKRLRPRQRILCIVPESGRALIGFMMLEAVHG